MPGPGRAWVAPGPGGPWSAQLFIHYQLSQVINFWRQGRPAVFRLESRSDGQAQLRLTFQLPSPSEIISPPPHSFPTPNVSPNHPAPRPQRTIMPLFPRGEVPTFQPSHPPQRLSSKQRKSYRRSVLHRASQATTNLPPALPGTLRWNCSKLLQQAVTALTKSPKKRPRSSSSYEAEKNLKAQSSPAQARRALGRHPHTRIMPMRRREGSLLMLPWSLKMIDRRRHTRSSWP